MDLFLRTQPSGHLLVGRSECCITVGAKYWGAFSVSVRTFR